MHVCLWVLIFPPELPLMPYHVSIYNTSISLLSIPVASCVVSPDGERIYVTTGNHASGEMVTLSRNGTVISTLFSNGLMWLSYSGDPSRHHVTCTGSGQVLVCGFRPYIIIQVDKDGRQRLAEVVTMKDGGIAPTCVYYSKHTGNLVVGMYKNNDILVLSTH